VIEPAYDKDGVTLYLGDCLEVMKQLPDASIDLVLADPPYGHNNNNNDLAHRWEAALGIVEAVPGEWARPILNDGPEANDLVRAMFAEANRLLKPGHCCCCCCGGGGGPDPQFARWSLWLDEAIGFKQMVIWDKGGLGMGWHYRRNYETVLVGERPGAAGAWYGGHSVANVISGISGIKPSADEHPTLKPVALMERFVLWHSQAGEVVLDPFMGSGTTGVASVKHGRRFIGCELDPHWFGVAVKRISEAQMQPRLMP